MTTVPTRALADDFATRHSITANAELLAEWTAQTQPTGREQRWLLTITTPTGSISTELVNDGSGGTPDAIDIIVEWIGWDFAWTDELLPERQEFRQLVDVIGPAAIGEVLATHLT